MSARLRWDLSLNADIADTMSGEGVSEKMLTLLPIMGSVDVGQEHKSIKINLSNFFWIIYLFH